MKEEGKGLAYLLNCFPSLTTTFVYREVRAIRQLGLGISLFSIHKPVDKDLSLESRFFLNETYYLLPTPVLELLCAHLSYFLRRPLTYLGLLSTAIFSSGSPKSAWRSLLHLGLAAYTARVMERQGIGHIHAHFASNAASVGFFASRLMKATFSFTAHAFDLFADRLLLREKVRAAEVVVTISKYNRRYLMGYAPEGTNKIKVVHCGVDPCVYRPAERGGPIWRPKILSIGQLVEKKGFTYLIEALKALADRGMSFHCTILGDGYQRSHLERKVADYGLQDRVQLAGAVYQEVALDHLRAADIFVLPCVVARNGDRDGIPVALMEAMALGLPVVSTTISGIPELIQHRETGILVPPCDARALAEALGELLASQGLRRYLGIRGREKVIRDFHLGRTALEMKALFEACLGVPQRLSLGDEPRHAPLVGVKGG
jgi:glycosyltransferase involved in cell wall biosynthesis